MNLKKIILIGFVLVLGVLPLVGCFGANAPHMANELRFSLDKISDVMISYDEEKITFFESDSDELIIKEYMTENKSRYYAKVDQMNNSIHISEGKKPLFGDGFSRYVEVYLPATYQNFLKVTSTNGELSFSDIALDLSSIRIDCTSGNVVLDKAIATNIHISSTSGTLTLGHIEAGKIKLETTSGNVSCEQLNGNVTYITTSGTIDVKTAIGSGSYRANNSGAINVIYSEVSGNLSLFNKNDTIALTLPETLEFNFEAITKNGSVSTNFQQDVTVNARTTSGIVGNNPTVTVKVETNNGNIEVDQ